MCMGALPAHMSVHHTPMEVKRGVQDLLEL